MFTLRSFIAPLVFLFLALPQNGVGQDPLPKWMTEAEKEIFQQYLYELPSGKSINPPASIPRTPAEFEEAQGVIITWASYSSELREIVRHARQAVTVYIVCSNISNVQSYLTAGNVPLENIIFIEAAFNSVWVRDYGPQSIYLAEDDQLAFVDWVYNRPRPNDNLIPGVMANYLSLPIFQMTNNPNRLIATGGNFMTDGFGTGFSSELILTENSSLSETQIDNIIHNYMGISRYIKMPELPYDNISHIDMHMKLLDEETLLVGQFPTGVSDGPFIEANLQYVLNNHQSVYNRPYKVVRIPMVPSSSGNYPPNASYRTFTNSIVLNNLVLVPTYGHYLDNEGLQIYQEAMPGYNVVGINMEAVIGASGAIHCITREIAADDPILFAHARPDQASTPDESYEIKACITSHSGIENATLHWTTDLSLGFMAEEMILENDTFRVWIPAEAGTAEIAYYFSATNGNGKTSSKPLVAPEGYYTLSINSTVGFHQRDRLPGFMVYPNPSEGKMLLTMPASSKDVELLITTIHGQVIRRQTIAASIIDPMINIDLTGQPAGIYLIRISSGTETQTQKVVIR
jgi:agmatine/peptidylarginine deiminase